MGPAELDPGPAAPRLRRVVRGADRRGHVRRRRGRAGALRGEREPPLLRRRWSSASASTERASLLYEGGREASGRAAGRSCSRSPQEARSAREHQRPPRPRAADEPAAAQGLRRPRPGLHPVLARRRHGRRATRGARRRTSRWARTSARPDCADPDLRARLAARCRRRSCSRSGRSPTPATRIAFTTIGAWRGAFGPVELDGHTYGAEGARVPQGDRAAAPVAAAASRSRSTSIPGDERDREALEANGWRLVDPRATVPGPLEFRDYVQGSGAEFSVAQGIYVETNSGWFSDRTVRYLASGRPVAGPGHRLQREPPRRRRAAGLPRPRRGRGGRASGSPPTTSATAAPRARSRRSTSTRTPCCPASSRRRGSALTGRAGGRLRAGERPPGRSSR